MNPVDPLDFVSRTVQAAAQFPEGRNWRALSKLSAAHPAVASYLESALDILPRSVDSELISLTLGAWQISLEICPQLRKITSSHMIARENSGQTDWDILRSRGRAVQDFYRLYERFAPLKAISERLHLAQNEEQEKRFLICCKSILDAFREAVRLSPRFSIRRSHEYEIRASLDDIAPEIWRTFRVSGAARISHLHEALQLVMGWKNCHLHSFQLDDIEFGALPPESVDFEDEFGYLDEREFRLEELAQGQRIILFYQYDFGDSWMHTLDIKPVGPSREIKARPLCVAGARACPPEDCGGSGDTPICWKRSAIPRIRSLIPCGRGREKLSTPNTSTSPSSTGG